MRENSSRKNVECFRDEQVLFNGELVTASSKVEKLMTIFPNKILAM